MNYNELKEQTYKNSPEEDHVYLYNFWSKVLDSPEEGGCWQWQGSKDQTGRGSYPRGKQLVGAVTAPRIIYMLTNDVKLERSDVLYHTCGDQSCMNPDHMWIGKRKDAPGFDEFRKSESQKRGGRKPGSKFLGEDTEELVRCFHRNGYTKKEVERRFKISRYYQNKILNS